MNIIGIDLGTSATKIVECDKKCHVINKMISGEKSVYKVLDEFIEANNIDMKKMEKIVLTGVGSSKISDETIRGVSAIKVNEFIGIATGGLFLSNKKEAIIVSAGTGTAFVRVGKNNDIRKSSNEDSKENFLVTEGNCKETCVIRHLGGTGVGGGTLINLCDRFLNTNSFNRINELASEGSLSNVDLTIQDITDEEIKTLPKDLTAANFGKLSKEANDSDIALGIINLIFETIGMMAVFVSRNDEIKDIVLIGTLSKLLHSKVVFDKIDKISDITLTIPEDAEFAVAIGVIKNYIDSIDK